MPKVITEKDGISIGIMLALLGSLAMGVAWAVRLEAQIDGTAAHVSEFEAKRSEDLNTARIYTQTLQEVNVRLSRIEGRLGIEGSRPKGH